MSPRLAPQHTRWSRLLPLLAVALLVLPVLSACGFGDDDPGDERTGKITWYQGMPPAEGDASLAGVMPTPDPSQQQPPVGTQAPASDPTSTAAPEPTSELVTNTILTDEQIALYEPNELGNVPVLMYHNIVEEYGPGQEGDVLFRTIDEFRTDLQWLYENNFYVIPFYDYVTNQIRAPAGKKPFVLTFDDSRPNQFNYLIGDDGSVSIDPNSAVGIMEEFFAAHPDFGRTAFFSILPIWCFDYEAPDQTPYCEQKLQWLVDNGYEAGNHTWDHQDLSNESNKVFEQKIADTSLWLEERVPEGRASRILILPYGVFPNGENSDRQWDMIRDGWTYEGEEFKLTSVVAAGANPAYSPSSVDFDVMSIARIGAKDFPKDGEADLFFNYWFGQFEANPESLYTSDGHPDTITFPAGNAAMLDEEKAEAEGKEVIEY